MGKLTDTSVRAEVRRATKDAVLNDGASGKGGGSLRLKIRVGARGTTATWFAWWQQDGKPKTKTLGEYPDVALADARKLAEQAVAQAKNPAPIMAAPEERTLEKLFAGYIAGMRKDDKASADEVEGRLAAAAAELGASRQASDVTTDEITALLEAIDARGARVMADRMRAYLSAAFNWGIRAATDYRVPKDRRKDWGLRVNPVAAIRRDTNASNPGERNLSTAELRALWYGLDDGGFTLETAACIRLLVLLGQRVKETLRMDGREIDFDARQWVIPRAKTKIKARPHVVPLPAAALPTLRELVKRHGMGPLFPPGVSGDGERMESRSVNQAIRRWLGKPGNQVGHFTTRDIRRTVKSRQGDGARIDRFTRDLLQQHAKGDTGGIHYDQADYLPQMREAMAKWEAWLSQALADYELQADVAA